MKRLTRLYVLVAALTLAAACTDYPTGSGGPGGPGTLILRLSTPHTDDGAVLFEVSGPPIDSASAANTSLRLFTRRADGSTVVGAVLGAVEEGAVVTLQVPDLGAAAGYTARVIEVADRHDALRASLAGYALTVVGDGTTR